ncbi:hypothetical protein ACOCEA_00635 [Maribacter sp. CXY002]
MKKLFFAILITGSIMLANSCEYDDSNDIDILKPNDSTDTAITVRELPL